MKRCHLRTFAFVGVAFLFAGCHQSNSPVQPTLTVVDTPASAVPAYRLTGHVADTAIRPVAGARVEVVSGPRAGTFATTDASGFFTMPGTFDGSIEIIATKDGYISDTNSVPPFWPPSLPPRLPSDHYQVAFWLEPVGTVNTTGVYSLTVSADSMCAGLPAEARARTYTATISTFTPTNVTSLLLRASGARFFTTHNRGGVVAAGDFVGIALSITDRGQNYSVAGIVEELGERSYVAIHGMADGTWDPSGMTVPFRGTVEFCPGEPGLVDDLYSCTAPARILCESEHHRLALVRR